MEASAPRLAACITVAAVLGLAACERDPDKPAPSTPPAASIGGASVDPGQSVMAAMAHAPNLTTFVNGAQSAGLTASLGQPGPFTVFAPDNAAFETLPVETREALAGAGGTERLRKLMTYHVVPGRLTVADLAARAQAGGGEARFVTVAGDELSVSLGPDGSPVLTDGAGAKIHITQPDRVQANGVVHIVDAVASPAKNFIETP